MDVLLILWQPKYLYHSISIFCRYMMMFAMLAKNYHRWSECQKQPYAKWSSTVEHTKAHLASSRDPPTIESWQEMMTSVDGPVNRKFLALVAPRIEHVGKSVGKSLRFIIQFMQHPNHRSCSPVSPASQMEHAVLGSLATSMRGVLVRSVTFGAAAGADSAATFDQSPNLAVTQASWRTKIWRCLKSWIPSHHHSDFQPFQAPKTWPEPVEVAVQPPASEPPNLPQAPLLAIFPRGTYLESDRSPKKNVWTAVRVSCRHVFFGLRDWMFHDKMGCFFH